MTLLGNEFWVVSVPYEQTADESFNKQKVATANVSTAYRLLIPDLKVFLNIIIVNI